MQMLMDVLWWALCVVATSLMFYVPVAAYMNGWQYVGDKFDWLADKIWHIDNTYSGSEEKNNEY